MPDAVKPDDRALQGALSVLLITDEQQTLRDIAATTGCPWAAEYMSPRQQQYAPRVVQYLHQQHSSVTAGCHAEYAGRVSYAGRFMVSSSHARQAPLQL